MCYKIREFFINHNYHTSEELARYCSQVVISSYPELRVRWAKIYGNRWAYLFGNSEGVSLNSKRIRLNDGYGIYIDNLETLSLKELEELTAALKECFTGDTTF
jgi:hypothetical protein